MQVLFGSLWADLVAAVLSGLIGGLGLGFLQEHGIEVPRRRSKVETVGGTQSSVTYYLDLGFLADMGVGAIAAVIIYALNTPNSQLQLIGVGLTSGLGGAGILKGFVQARRNQELSGIAREAVALASVQMPDEPSPLPIRGDEPPLGPSPLQAQYKQRVDMLQQRIDDLTR